MYWSVFYVCKSIRWKNHVLSCPSTIVNLFFTLRIDISLDFDFTLLLILDCLYNTSYPRPVRCAR